MHKSQWLALGAVASLILWIVLTFAMDLRSGWTHAPLVVGALLIVMTVVEGKGPSR